MPSSIRTIGYPIMSVQKAKDNSNSAGIYKESLVWDAHAGIFPDANADLSNVVDWKSASVDYVSINIGFDVMDWTESIAVLSAYRRQLGAKSDSVTLINNLDDVYAAKSCGKLAVSFDIEGVNALNNDIGMVSFF